MKTIREREDLKKIKERLNSEKPEKMRVLLEEELKKMGISLPVDYSLTEDWQDGVYLLYKDRKIKTLLPSHVTKKTVMKVISEHKRFSK